MPEDTTTSAEAWRVEMMRLTAFPAARAHPGDAADVVGNWWSKLFQVPYEKSTQNLNIGTTQLQGMVGDAFMLMEENPMRFELRRFTDNPTNPLPATDTLPLFTSVVRTFEALAARWLEFNDCPSLRRLAFGAALLIPTADQKSGNETLNGYLPQVEIHPQSGDFQYQINRRRPSSAVTGLQLNRLSKWSLQYIQNLAIISDGTVIQGPGTLACRLELDMNSVNIPDALPQESLPSLFNELVELGNEITQEGDIQ